MIQPVIELAKTGKLNQQKRVRKNPYKFRSLANVGTMVDIPPAQLKSAELLINLLFDAIVNSVDVNGV